MELDLPQQFFVFILVHWHINVDLLLLLHLDGFLHLSVLNGHVEVNLVLFLHLHVIQFTVVVVIHGDVEEVLLLLLDLDWLNLGLEFMRERAGFGHVERNLIFPLAHNEVLLIGLDIRVWQVHLHLVFPRFLETLLRLGSSDTVACIWYDDFLLFLLFAVVLERLDQG